MDLQDPDSKMSTSSASEEGTLYVLDEPTQIERKLKRAVTDSGESIRRAPDKPGVTNLIDILAAVRGVEPAAIERDFAAARYGELKTALAAEVIIYLAPVRERYAQLRADVAGLEGVLADGADRARAIAAATLADVRDAMGVGPPR
jgi:tryptophanyl-tRNA synthetase